MTFLLTDVYRALLCDDFLCCCLELRNHATSDFLICRSLRFNDARLSNFDGVIVKARGNLCVVSVRYVVDATLAGTWRLEVN